MSFAIINGRNDGYPCIPELNELTLNEKNPPYNDFMMTVQAGSYPTIKCLTEGKFSAGTTPPYPEFMMQCCPELNDGYPCILKLGKLVETIESSLYAGDKKIIGFFFGDKEVKSAYCRGITMFRKYYVKINV